MNYLQIDKELVKLINLAYKNNNWLTRGSQKNQKVFVFSSSNGLYFPNTSKQFNDTILVNDTYEWQNISKGFEEFNKLLFLRDVHKQWYLNGINSEVNSIEKIVELVKNLVNDKTLITVGTSSGGFLSTILGLSIESEMVFSFSGQFQLSSTASIDPNNNTLLQANLDSKYFDLSFLLKKNCDTCLFYFVGAHSKTDLPDITFAKRFSKVKMFIFDTDVHGVPFPPFVLKYLLKKNKHEILKLHQYFVGSVISPIFFSFKVCGLLTFTLEYIRYIFNRTKGRIRKFINE